MKSFFKFAVILIFTFISSVGFSQFTIGTGVNSYYFLNSTDNNIHYGPSIRGGIDFDRFQLDLGFTYFLPVISNVNTYAYEIDYNTLFPNRIDVVNSVDGTTFQTDLQMNYYIWGQPIGGKGFYGFLGSGIFMYTQQNHLSHFDPLEFYSSQYIDEAIATTTQLIFNFGFGAKFPMRKSNFYIESKFSIPTDPYKEYGLGVETSPFISVMAGVRFHVITRKNRYQRIAMGRTGKQIKRSKKRIRN